MVTFSVKNIQVGHPKNTNIEKKFDGRKNIFFLMYLTRQKKIKKMTDQTIFLLPLLT